MYRATGVGALLRGAGALVAFSGLALAGPVSASIGSVPAEVTAYAIAPDGLLATLEDFVGIGGNGQGIQFGDAASVGQLNRVFTFTDAYLAGEETDMPVQLSNRWTAPVLIDSKAIGLAVIWVNPENGAIELAEFLQDIGTAAALSDVGADLYVVEDSARGAWFTLKTPELIPIVGGTSGVSGPTTLSVYQGLLASRTTSVETPNDDIDQGSALSIATIAGAVVAVILVLLVPLLVSKRRRAPDASTPHPETPALPTEPAATPVAVVAPVAVEPAAMAASVPEAALEAKPAGSMVTTVRAAPVGPLTPAGTKPLPARPAPVRSAGARPAGERPAVVRPAVVRPAGERPAGAKPPVAKAAGVKAPTKPVAKRVAKPTATEPPLAKKPVKRTPAAKPPVARKPASTPPAD